MFLSNDGHTTSTTTSLTNASAITAATTNNTPTGTTSKDNGSQDNGDDYDDNILTINMIFYPHMSFFTIHLFLTNTLRNRVIMVNKLHNRKSTFRSRNRVRKES